MELLNPGSAPDFADSNRTFSTGNVFGNMTAKWNNSRIIQLALKYQL